MAEADGGGGAERAVEVGAEGAEAAERASGEGGSGTLSGLAPGSAVQEEGVPAAMEGVERLPGGEPWSLGRGQEAGAMQVRVQQAPSSIFQMCVWGT